MMKIAYMITILLALQMLFGCKKDIPEPEMQFKVIPMATVHAEDDLPVLMEKGQDRFMVQHHIKEDRVFVECILPDITFRENSPNQGKIILYVDGKKKEEITTAAFIIKGLPEGNHQIRLEVVNLKNEPYHLQKEFTVSIP